MRLALTDERQPDGHSCGPAVYRCLARYWGLGGLSVRADPFDGLHPSYLESVLRRAGAKTISGSMDVEDLRYHVRRGRPVACLIRREDSGHWVCVGGVERGRVYYHDPLGGPASATFAEWSAAWHDADRLGTVFRSHGIVAWI